MTARVLVVDDVPANLRLLQARLDAEYYEVATAASGPEALLRMRDWLPDIVLLDVMMPGMDGYEVCRRIKADDATRHVPVVVLTALTDRADAVRGLEAGADDFLSKPVDQHTLFARLRALLRSKQVLDAFRARAAIAQGLGLQPPPRPEPGVAGARVLVVEDDPAAAAELARALAADTVDARACHDPAEAPAMLAGGGYELVVIGLSADGGRGLRLASRLRAATDTRDLPLLLVADPGQNDPVLRGFDIGANDHVLRPVHPAELRARARNQILRHRHQEALRDDIRHSLELAVTDGLTGLRNRHYVDHHLRELLRSGTAAVILIDVDRFKQVNDTHGHATGDHVLRAVSARIRDNLRAVDLAGRYGGEEFLVVVPSASAEEGLAVAERLRAVMREAPVMLDGGIAVPVTLSLGVALPPTGADARDAVRAADNALYRAKRTGRDRVEMAVPADWRQPDRPPAEPSPAGATPDPMKDPPPDPAMGRGAAGAAT